MSPSLPGACDPAAGALYGCRVLAADFDPQAMLFKSAGYQKRSYIRRFIRVVERLGKVLRFVEAIPRSRGMALARQLEEVDGFVPMVRDAMKDRDNRSVKDERVVLWRFVGEVLATEAEAGTGTGAAPAGTTAATDRARQPILKARQVPRQVLSVLAEPGKVHPGLRVADRSRQRDDRQVQQGMARRVPRSRIGYLPQDRSQGRHRSPSP